MSEHTEWFEEKHENFSLKIRIKETLFSEQSQFQKVEVFETFDRGKLLAHDGMIMVTERDEHIYHDMITHVPMFTHPEPKRVLVIGGGDGGTVREVLKHPSVEQVTMVEIDPMVVEVSRKFIGQTADQLSNPKVNLLFQDGVEFVKNTPNTYDVIIVDSSEPIGPATPLFNKDFYLDLNKRLSDQGIVVSQAESPHYDMEMQKVLVNILADIFPKVHLYNYSNETYPGGLWSFSYASKGLCPLKDFQPQRVSGEFSYYTPQLHWGSFQLPQNMLKSHKGKLSPLPSPQWN